MISECESHHVECRSTCPPKLPTRVIDVQESMSPTVHIHISNEDGEFDQYLTLSYCWGGDQPVKALKGNLEALKSGITVATLPQTIQDAVHNTRQLGYRYLWVDALCILQDDKEDKATEIAAMADIYHNSTATILAVTSSSVDHGYLHHPRRQPLFFTVPVSLPNGERGQIGIGHPYRNNHLFWNDDPLSKRGWAYQEFLLAKRVLFYGPYEVLFHCRNLGFTRLSASYIIYDNDHQPSSRTFFYSQDRAKSWSDLVLQYTYRSLTFPEDRVHSIAGIISALEEAWDEKCIFGAWESWFIEHMTWYTTEWPEEEWLSLRRSKRAPSWSWLSIDEDVGIHCKHKLRPDCIITADLREVAKGANLTLNCQVVPESEWPIMPIGSNATATIDVDIGGDHEWAKMPRFYLYLGGEVGKLSEEKDAYALLVIEEETNFFRRIGLWKVYLYGMDLDEDFEQKLPHMRRDITLL
jgi:hypothetical protein